MGALRGLILFLAAAATATGATATGALATGVSAAGSATNSNAGHGIPFMTEALTFLAVALVVVLLLSRLRLSPVLGYLFAGVLVGPSGFDLIADVHAVGAVAELGVVLLLFVIGLDLSIERFRSLGRWVFGLGSAQVLATGAVIGGVAALWGNPPPVAILIGAGLALSSTAVVVQLLVERGEVASPVGRMAFAVLLLQDLAVVPLLVLVPALGHLESGQLLPTLAISLVKAVAAVAAIQIIGRYLISRLLAGAAATGHSDVLTASTLFIVLGTAWLTHSLGLSAALGAFLAGMILADSSFRHHVEADIQPFKGLMLGLFFLSVGMTIDVALIVDNALWVLPSVVGLMVLKAAVIVALARAFGAAWQTAIPVGILLAEGGEFAFVILGTALANGVMPAEVAQFMFAVVGLSIMVTPFLPAASKRLLEWLKPIGGDGGSKGTQPASAPEGGHVIVAGFGRVGQTIGAFLTAQQVPYVAVDLDASRVTLQSSQGFPVTYGDAGRPDILRRLGADTAVAVILTVDDPPAAERTLEVIRHSWPHLRVFARARDRGFANRLVEMGAAAVVPETFESSIALAVHALGELGIPATAVEDIKARIRSGDIATPDSGSAPAKAI